MNVFPLRQQAILNNGIGGMEVTDFISREAMHEANRDEWEGAYGFIDCDIFEDNESMIDRVPAADVRPVVHGEWFPAKDGYYGHVMCSACHKIESHKTDFCPSCGADMKPDKTCREDAEQ